MPKIQTTKVYYELDNAVKSGYSTVSEQGSSRSGKTRNTVIWLCVFLMNHYSGNETVNAGTGKELSIKELTELVAKVVGYEGEILWDTTRPDGTPRKLLDVSKATALGWTYKTELEEGIRLAYKDFLENPMRAER